MVEVRVLLPKNAAGKGAVDVAALYGFRSTAPDLFFLSPWEFVQWILPERLQPPSASNVVTKWTLAGKRKLSQKTKGAAMEAGVDYELDMTAVQNFADLFPFPDDMRLFGKHVPETYLKFRQTWILRRRQRPVVPAPVVCPMPSRKQSKEHRSKIYSVYQRPWSRACNESCVMFKTVASSSEAPRCLPFLNPRHMMCVMVICMSGCRS